MTDYPTSKRLCDALPTKGVLVLTGFDMEVCVAGMRSPTRSRLSLRNVYIRVNCARS